MSLPVRALNLGSPKDRKLRDRLGMDDTSSMSMVAWKELLDGPLDESEPAVTLRRITWRLLLVIFTAAWLIDRLYDCGGARRQHVQRNGRLAPFRGF